MNILKPSTWFGGGRKANDPGSSVVVRANRSLGIWQDALGGFTPRTVNPHFYEALRESLPVMDGAINRLVTLDGIVRVEGGNDALVQLIENELLPNIPVNDEEAGLQAFYASVGNELYEQGLGIGEMVFDRKGRELIGLRVADSKGIAFNRDVDSQRLRWWYRPPAEQTNTRRDGTDRVEAVLRNTAGSAAVGALLAQHNYVELDPKRMVYSVLMPEADNPYGVSLFRSMEFVAQLLLKIENATGQVWDRFGDPAFNVTYKTKNRQIATDSAKLNARRNQLARDLAAVLDAKRAGNSADFVQAIHADDDIVIQVIGAAEQVLEIEMPARHMLEQIVAKTGIASWALGFHWSTAERLAEQQSELMLQESKVRFEKRLTGMNRIVATWLRGRGQSWKAGDWKLAQQLPNLHDELKRAQSGFLRAQTELMLNGTLVGRQGGPALPGTDDGAAKGAAIEIDGRAFGGGVIHLRAAGADHRGDANKKAAGDGEPWAEPDPQLPLIERSTIGALLTGWTGLQSATLAALGLPTGKRAKAEQTWSFTPQLRSILTGLADQFERAQGGEHGALMRGIVDAYLRGVENAAAEIDATVVLDEARQAAVTALRDRGFELVRNVVARAYRDDIIAELAAGEYDGDNPTKVAERLRKRFAAHDYDWERLARSEIAQAQVLGKEAEYQDMGVERYDYLTAEDSRVSAICRSHAANGPYPVGQGPLPMRDSHPNCRCSIIAIIDD